MTIMNRTSDTRWYEPPPPRDWKTNPSVLQRIESAENLRKSLLDSTAKASGSIPLRKSFQPEPIDMYGRSRSMASLPSTPPTLRGSLPGSPNIGLGQDDGRVAQPSFSRQTSNTMGGSVNNLNSTFVTRGKIKVHGQVDKTMAKTPPSRPRTSTLTKFRPLPAIKHSAGSSRSDPMDSNNNGGAQSHPPPLLRSKTFDVIETHLQSLPVVSDDDSSFSDSSDDGSNSSYSYKDRSVSDASDSGIVSAESKKGGKQSANNRESIFERGEISSAVPVQTVTVMIEGKLISEYVSQNKLGATRSRPCTQYGRDMGRSDSTAAYDSSDSNTDSSESDNSSSEENNEEGSEGTRATSLEVPGQPIINNVDNLQQDMIIYIKMPDDTLMLASSPRDRTLRELLTIVKETNVNGNCVMISRKGLTVGDLDKSLYELGIHDNTTLHLLSE